MNVAIIPARGGSKRIPKKNIKLFLGKPIIAYSIEAAQKSGLFDRIIVSTDSEDIGKVAMKYGADIPFMRPVELADDYTGTNAVVKHALQRFADSGEKVDYACCIYATAPFLEPRYLMAGYEKLIQTSASFVFSVTSFEFPIQRAVRINTDGSVEAFYPDLIKMRSQDLEELFHDAGQFYWGKTGSFLNDTDIYASGALPVILPRHSVQDIDTIEDWERAELMFQAWVGKK
ncbi:MAG: pseudaminic acid cytidylyltransferase [Desulfobacteraceae bacterium]|nr:MAG: pseudaminic acid cytidylyltransferase [Desulfobacteraceae bacterium]